MSAASFVPEIANDYSLAFLPLAAAAVLGARDPRPARIAAAIAALWWQPIAFPIPGLLLLAVKLVGLIAVGASIVARAEEIGAGEQAGALAA